MSEQDDFLSTNEQWWQKMVRDGCGYTRPWFDLQPALVRQYALGQLHPAPEPLSDIYPASVLAGVEGQDVLCLAAGGGQQSVVFGLLGARVTVVDLVAGQLEGDRRAAAHYCYPVSTLRADMRDLSALDDESFDLVYQAPSMAYVTEVRPVYAEVTRVLRTGGLYRAGLTNPAAEFVDSDSWDGQGYRITVPYAVRRQDGDGEGPVQFRHFLSEIFGDLLAERFSIQGVQEAPCHLRHDPEARPGSWEHVLMYIPWLFCIVAKKE